MRNSTIFMAVLALFNTSLAFSYTAMVLKPPCETQENEDFRKAWLLAEQFAAIRFCENESKNTHADLSESEKAEACLCGAINGSIESLKTWKEIVSHPLSTISNLYRFAANFNSSMSVIWDEIQEKLHAYPQLTPAQRAIVRCDVYVEIALGGIAIPKAAVGIPKMLHGAVIKRYELLHPEFASKNSAQKAPQKMGDRLFKAVRGPLVTVPLYVDQTQKQRPRLREVIPRRYERSNGEISYLIPKSETKTHISYRILSASDLTEEARKELEDYFSNYPDEPIKEKADPREDPPS